MNNETIGTVGKYCGICGVQFSCSLTDRKVICSKCKEKLFKLIYPVKESEIAKIPQGTRKCLYKLKGNPEVMEGLFHGWTDVNSKDYYSGSTKRGIIEDVKTGMLGLVTICDFRFYGSEEKRCNAAEENS